MKCLSCNVTLNDFEATRRFADSGAFVDMCIKCCKKADIADIPVIERADLKPEEEIEEMESDDGEEYTGCNGGQCG